MPAQWCDRRHARGRPSRRRSVAAGALRLRPPGRSHGSRPRRVGSGRRGRAAPKAGAPRHRAGAGGATHGPGVGLVWLDAHGDFNTPETDTSGFLDGQGLAIAVGRCWRSLAATIPGFTPLPERDVVLVGARDLTHAQGEVLRDSEVTWLRPEDARRADRIAAAVASLAERVDVLRRPRATSTGTSRTRRSEGLPEPAASWASATGTARSAAPTRRRRSRRSPTSAISSASGTSVSVATSVPPSGRRDPVVEVPPRRPHPDGATTGADHGARPQRRPASLVAVRSGGSQCSSPCGRRRRGAERRRPPRRRPPGRPRRRSPSRGLRRGRPGSVAPARGRVRTCR
jgi:hypothetical protein